MHDANAVNAQRLSDGFTPLHVAAEKGDQTMLELFCRQSGIDLHIKDNNGLQAWEVAKEKNNEACMQILLAAIRGEGDGGGY
tara:strand:- start:528 stop:773 length:246 start_codon:yes stop_codon:yes gene_type:complete